ncbi:MAG: hypothetical protein RI924_1207 [Bacteroidota bacterium]|jgi:hypothetical protein
MKKRIIYLLMTGLSGQLLLSSCEKEELYPEVLSPKEFRSRELSPQYSNGSSSNPYYVVRDLTLYPIPKPDVDPTTEPDPEPIPWREK